MPWCQALLLEVELCDSRVCPLFPELPERRKWVGTEGTEISAFNKLLATFSFMMDKKKKCVKAK